MDERELLELIEKPESAEEKRALDALELEPARLLAAAQLRAGPGAMRPRDRPRWVLGAAAACAAAVVLVVLRLPSDPALALRELQRDGRPLEAAIAELPYAPYQPKRGPRDEAEFDRALRRLLEAREKGRPGAERSLAMLYLLRGGPGDAARADQALERAGQGPEVENDRGVALFARGDVTGALDHFTQARAQAQLPQARFNRALALASLGLQKRAADAFAALGAENTPWSGEAQQRAQSRPAAPPAPSRRLEVMHQLLAASSAEQLAQAQRDAQGMPDLLALAGKLDAQKLAGHAKLYRVYATLRERAVAGTAEAAELQGFARSPEVEADPLLSTAALQLAGYLHAVRGDWRAAQPCETAVLALCRARGCPVEVEAIALDELADLAALDGDFPAAHKLEGRAEALFTSVGARPQLAELYRKRAGRLLEEDRAAEAAAAAQLSVRELAQAGPPAALAASLEQAEEIADRRGLHHAAREFGEAAVELARASGSRDVEVDAVARLATSSAALGDFTDARQRLSEEIDRLEQAGHAASAARLRGRLAQVLLSSGDAAGALAASERGLAAAHTGTWESSRALLHVSHARALRQLGRAAEASAALSGALDELAKTIAAASDPSTLLEDGNGIVAELASFARTADELALPLDRIRAAALGVPPASPGWSRALPPGACVLVLIKSDNGALQGIATRDGGQVRAVAADALAVGTERCEEIWLFADPPLDRVERATGIVTSLSRLLAPEPLGAPPRALLVSAQASGDAAGAASALPGTDEERAALRLLGAEVTELSGERATPETALRLAAGEPFLHFAVHGFEGAFLQLAGESGRLAARDVAKAKLAPRTRVVLSACQAGAPGPRGVAWAFALAGAAAIAAPREDIADADAARWSQKFYAALARDRSFAQAAREAQPDARAPLFVVVK